jgi:histidinol-phosphate aminotransferase
MLLPRSSVRKTSGYVSARHLAQSAQIFLDANENSFGSVIGKKFGVGLNRYPDPFADAVRVRLARYMQIPKENILIGNGSDEIIWLTLLAFLNSGERVLIFEPTFAMYRVFAEILEARVENLGLTENFEPKIPARPPQAKIAFFCTPNNPTGQVLAPEKILAFAKKFRGLVVVDEAYGEFAEEKMLSRQLCPTLGGGWPQNLVILRTFSKAWGLAGVRCGYAVATPEIITTLKKVRAPYSVNTVTQKIILAALQKEGVMKKMVRKILTEREKLACGLENLGLTVFPSDANFLLVRFPPKISSTKVYNTLVQKHGLVVRDFGSHPLLKNCLRITVGTPKENAVLLAALRKILFN